MTARWLVNLVPLASADSSEVRVVLLEANREGLTDSSDAAELLEYARLRWPGEVLDVVGPDGRSYLLCSIPPWEQRALPPGS